MKQSDSFKLGFAEEEIKRLRELLERAAIALEIADEDKGYDSWGPLRAEIQAELEGKQ
jgi:hypothetical protein